MTRPPRNARAHQVKLDPMDRNVSRPGAFYFVSRGSVKIAGIIHGCPCGCGGRNLVYLPGGGAGRPEWRVVEGEWPRVTLSPSIAIKYDVGGNFGKDGGHHWYGHLRDGVFVEDVPTTGEKTDAPAQSQ